jgi:outer membrane protein assembly factor BamB
MHRNAAAPWPHLLLEQQRPAELIADQVVNPATGVAYALISRTRAPMRGPYTLECTELHTGAVHKGPVFPVGSLTIAAGYLWVFGAPRPGARPVIYQVDPATLARIRPIPSPPGPADFGGAAFATGSSGSVWIGSYRTVLRIGAATGTTLMRVTLPPDLAVSDISVAPASSALYVSAARVVRYGVEGLVMLEYDARSGHLLAAASSGVLRYSVAGAGLTAVPGGVWASFRTGMQGLTVHLRQKGLRMMGPPGPGIARTRPNGVFHWVMFEDAAYGGGAVWVANQAGTVACLDPRTGVVRASEQLSRTYEFANQLIYQLEAIDPATHTIYALNLKGLLQIRPPRRCWR